VVCVQYTSLSFFDSVVERHASHPVSCKLHHNERHLRSCLSCENTSSGHLPQDKILKAQCYINLAFLIQSHERGENAFNLLHPSCIVMGGTNSVFEVL
jgi:hypothetical protein